MMVESSTDKLRSANNNKNGIATTPKITPAPWVRLLASSSFLSLGEMVICIFENLNVGIIDFSNQHKTINLLLKLFSMSILPENFPKKYSTSFLYKRLLLSLQPFKIKIKK